MTTAPAPTAQIVDLPLSSIVPGPNHRKRFAEADLKTLAASIVENGLLQPVTVRPHADAYELVAGERRWRACALAGLGTIRAIVRDEYADDAEASFAAMLTENTGRQDLRPMEEARAYGEARDLFGWDVAETARRAGVAEFRVKWRLALLTLAPRIADLVDNFDLPTGFARAMTQLDHNRQMIALASYQATPAITLAQFEAVCGRLLTDQQQDSLFGDSFLTVEEFSLDKVKADAHRARPSRAALVELIRNLTSALDATGGDPSLVAAGQAVEG